MILTGETEVLTEQDAQRTCNLTPPEHYAQWNDSEQVCYCWSSSRRPSVQEFETQVLKCKASFQCEVLQAMLCFKGSLRRRPDDDSVLIETCSYVRVFFF
jgi:hypothetical protein